MYNFCKGIVFVVLNHHQAGEIKLRVTSVLCRIAVVVLFYPNVPVIMQGLMFWVVTTRLVITECFRILRLVNKQLFVTLRSDRIL